MRESENAPSSKPSMPSQCPFCVLPVGRIVDRNDAGVAVRDAYPVSPGHTLIISSRHVGSLFELSTPEREQLFSLIDRAKGVLDEQYRPDAYNIGINDGVAAGQTVPHLHIHLIPRYKGDLPDPRGGVRWIIPKKADYWSKRG
ncbi:HIT family protein [Burkholderia sp. JPY481]